MKHSNWPSCCCRFLLVRERRSFCCLLCFSPSHVPDANAGNVACDEHDMKAQDHAATDNIDQVATNRRNYQFPCVLDTNWSPEPAIVAPGRTLTAMPLMAAAGADPKKR